MTPKKLALSIALGFTFGMFPLIGVTTFICLFLAVAFKLNIAAIQLINYFVYPLQIMLLLPLMKIGSLIAGTNPIPYTITQLLDMFNNDFFGAMNLVWRAHLMGMLAWLILIVPIGLLIYFILLPVFIKIAKV